MSKLVSFSREITIDQKKVTIYPGEVNGLEASAFLGTVTTKTYACECCKKRVPTRPKWVFENIQAAYTASRLCKDCHFWLAKLDDPDFLIVAGSCYSFNDPVFCPDKQSLLRLHPRPGDFVVKLLGMDRYVFNCGRVWEQGKVDPSLRRYLPDTAEWICPTCLKPFHKDGDGYGYICDGCKEQHKDTALAA